MARTTALDLVTASLQDLGVLGESETPSGAAGQSALDTLNAMIDGWKAEKLMVPSLTRSTVAITASDGDYTIGPTGNIAVVRPVFLEDVRYSDSTPDPDYEWPLKSLTEQGYAALPMKAQTSTVPTAYFYNPTYPNGTINLFPIPTSSTLTLIAYHWTAITVFAALSTTFSLPPAYERMIVKNLAVELAPSWLREPSATLLRQASQSMRTVKESNTRLVDLGFEASALTGNGGTYSIWSDQ